MFEFFHYDSPFITWVVKIANLIFVSALWTVFCIPVFTSGASTVALYYTIQKCVKNNRDTVWNCFWGSFKSNFKQATAITLLLLVVVAFLSADIAIISNMTNITAALYGASVVFKFLIILLCVYAMWMFFYMARFDGTVKMYLGNGIILAIMHLPMTILLGVLGFGAVILLYAVRPLCLIVPGIIVYVMSLLSERVFRKYMSEEDKAEEDERNMDYRDEYVGKFAEMKKHLKNKN